MEAGTIAMLKHQLNVTWSLADLVLAELTDDEALWCPSAESWTVHMGTDGRWHADWTEPEPWPAPPASIAWIQWHIIWWWSTVIDRSFGQGELRRTDVSWPGAAEAHVAIARLRGRWIEHLDSLTDTELADNALTRWPYTDGRPFGYVTDWVNIELMKNVAEMCVLRRMTPYFVDGTFTASDETAE